MISRPKPWRQAPLALAVTLATFTSQDVGALTFTVGEIEGQFDSNLSVGTSWSTQSADPDLIGANNGGDGLSQTADDGHLNFKKGATFSKIFKGLHDLELKYGDTGIFLRGKYWYDFELKDENRPFKNIDDNGRKEGAKSSGAQLLDAFVYHNYTIADLPGSVRLGKQVVSWGESTFIQNGINAINPIDVAAFRRPGAEIKEGLIPVNMFYVSQSLTDTLSAEAFYQLEWDQTVLDNCGTFFSISDVMSDGCDNNLAVGQTRSHLSSALPAAYRDAALSALGASGVMWGAPDEGIIVRRRGDKDARDGGQWGTALRYVSEPLDTEFGAYFINYHSRSPFFSATNAPASAYDAAGLAGSLVGAGIPEPVATALAPALLPVSAFGRGEYFVEYPEDIQLYGLSFSTTLSTGTAWSGELSYRPNAPVQVNATDLLLASLAPLMPEASLLPAGPGSELSGYRRKEITQFQTTLVHFFDQVMGADRLTVVGELGVVHVGGLESTSKVRYGRDSIFGPGPLPNGTCQTLNAGSLGSATAENVSKYCKDDGFVTSTSWGYRARMIWEYNNLIPSIELRPSIAWSHDVDGYGPNGVFNEGAKAVSLGLDASYLSTYSAGLSYTNFFGGDYNSSIDRDFVALSFGVSF
ncbi:DUF1302 domain-containing protein [Pseudomonas japonica]|uniref:Type V secretory pathway, adhesin AidA n=1 Tax=Pseudomonas japonica TaxID=256466 RepID=A0A239E3V9_9PSED|nr:DUF1302 domain-containing protein [Pseudomonas japonica]SNS39430.1 Protein of unknown function [Pseudomonas japonica]